jgi:hypothetical protein
MMRVRGDRTGELRLQVEYRRCGSRLLADQGCDVREAKQAPRVHLHRRVMKRSVLSL